MTTVDVIVRPDESARPVRIKGRRVKSSFVMFVFKVGWASFVKFVFKVGNRSVAEGAFQKC